MIFRALWKLEKRHLFNLAYKVISIFKKKINAYVYQLYYSTTQGFLLNKVLNLLHKNNLKYYS